MKQPSSIPTYIINLEKRTDRRSHIEKEFSDRPEFYCHLVKAIEDSVPAVGLYKSAHSVIAAAKRQNLPFVLICEDDHEFTKSYNAPHLKSYLDRLERYNADVFLGGVSWFGRAVQADTDLYWIDSFTGTQFLIIFSSFYQRILESPFGENDIIDKWISNLSGRIFVSVPMLSIQRDFGYSDVTDKNDGHGKVDKLFLDTIERWKILDEVKVHIQKSMAGYCPVSDEQDLQLPTYVINLAHRTDRLTHIKKQFEGKQEFDVSFINAKKRKNGAIGLWKSINQIIKIAKEQEDDVILICEDDHMFCNAYSKEILFEAIYQGAFLGADIILGGISSTQQVIPVSESLCWVNSFQCTQFTIVYSRFFQTILETDFDDTDAADIKLSSLTANKYVIHPFISLQKDFGYSDIPINNFGTDQYMPKLLECENNISEVRQMSVYLGSNKI